MNFKFPECIESVISVIIMLIHDVLFMCTSACTVMRAGIRRDLKGRGLFIMLFLMWASLGHTNRFYTKYHLIKS